MLHTIIQKNNYQDSIVLMLLTNQLLTLEGINNASIMMGTPANKDIFKTGGLYTEVLAEATSNDLVLVLDIEEAEVIETAQAEIESFLSNQHKTNNETGLQRVKTWHKALEVQKNAQVVVLSIPGSHAASEIERALDFGKHVFCFSDNVSLEDEVRLKKKAHELGLLLMGPDCGTGIINGIPIAFTNGIKKGAIGVVGASGTGIQEVTTLIHKQGEGVTQAIGTGGRDLNAAVGGITLKDGIVTLAEDPETKVIVVISKPPAPKVRDEVLALLRSVEKPTVTIFLGENVTDHEENLYRAYTLEEAATIAVQLLRHEAINPPKEIESAVHYAFSPEQRKIKGYYSGGTLAYEAAMLVSAGLHLPKQGTAELGYILKNDGHEIIDLGDDSYTQGKPHPMIDPKKRKEMLRQAADDPATAVILLDIVLGYGAHEDMAKELVPTIRELKQTAEKNNRPLAILATIVGTQDDPQNLQEQERLLKEAYVEVCQSNAQMVKRALQLLKKPLPLSNRKQKSSVSVTSISALQPSAAMEQLLHNQAFINVGLHSFAEAIKGHHGQVVQYDWQPTAGGNPRLQAALRFLEHVELKG